MSRLGNKIQEKFMAMKFRGKEICKPLNTGRIDEHVSCVREYVANIFFYTKNGKTIMIDAGYNYERLGEKMKWLGLDPKSIDTILITHFKNFCQSELLICYHVGISPLGGLVDSFSTTLFYHKP